MKAPIAAIAAFALAQAGFAQAAQLTGISNHKPPPGEARVGGGANSSETPTKFTFSTIDSVNTLQMCTAKGGTVEQRNGQSMCKTKDDNNTAMQGVSTTR